MSVGGATVEAAGGAVKKGLKYWLIGLGVTLLACTGIGALAGGLLFGGAVAAIGVGALVGAISGGALAFSPFGGAIGAAVAGIGAMLGGIFGARDHVKRGQKALDQQSAALNQEQAQLRQELMDMNQNGEMYLNPNAKTGHVDSLRQRDAQRQNNPPLGVG